MTESSLLQQALKDLGHAFVGGNVAVRGFQGRRMSVEMKISTSNPEYDIGFRKAGGAYECIADWFGLKEIDQKLFLQKLTQRYAYHAARARLQSQGFSLALEETHNDGRIHLVLRRIV